MLTRGYRVVRPPWGRGSLSGGVGAACVLSVCGACLMPVRPPWGRTYICVALRPRVRCAHPRLQNSSAPLGPPSPSPFRCKIAGATPSPSPFRCMPWWYRRPHTTSVQASREAVGPAGVALLYSRRGSNALCGCPAPASFGWQLSTGLLPWLAVQSVCPFDPLGAVHIYVWLSVRGFAMLTRGYRVVRPPWGRRPCRHSAAKSRERRRPRRHSAAKSLERRRPRHHPRSMPLWYRGPRAYVGATHPAMLPAPPSSPQHAVVVPPSPYHICTGIPRSCRPRRGRTTL